MQAKKPAVKTAALKKTALPRSSGLRISFKPADLGKTTDKTMAAQVTLTNMLKFLGVYDVMVYVIRHIPLASLLPDPWSSE